MVANRILQFDLAVCFQMSIRSKLRMRGMIHDLIKIPQTIKTCALEVIHSIGLY